MKKIIEVNNLGKEFDSRRILNNVSIDIKSGEIIGLLGVNGAGKTTFLKLISGLLEPIEGSVNVLGMNPWNERSKILKNLGIMIENPVFYEHLTAYENIRIHLEYMSMSDISKEYIESVLELVGLTDAIDKPISKFSLGMKQRLAIGRSISHNPKILLLDEPINGLDPIAIKDIRNLFEKLKSEGTTIILSSHILGEMMQTAESIVVLANGKLEQLGTVENLKNEYKENLEDYLIERMRG